MGTQKVSIRGNYKSVTNKFIEKVLTQRQLDDLKSVNQVGWLRNIFVQKKLFSLMKIFTQKVVPVNKSLLNLSGGNQFVMVA